LHLIHALPGSIIFHGLKDLLIQNNGGTDEKKKA